MNREVKKMLKSKEEMENVIIKEVVIKRKKLKIYKIRLYQ